MSTPPLPPTIPYANAGRRESFARRAESLMEQVILNKSPFFNWIELNLSKSKENSNRFCNLDENIRKQINLVRQLTMV